VVKNWSALMEAVDLGHSPTLDKMKTER